MVELKQNKIGKHSSVSRKYSSISNGWNLLQAGSFGLHRQSESLIQYSMGGKKKKKRLIWKSCAFTIISINYYLQIMLPNAAALTDLILNHLTGKIAKYHQLSLPLVNRTLSTQKHLQLKL